MVSTLGQLYVSCCDASAVGQRSGTWKWVSRLDPTRILTVAGGGLGSVVDAVCFLWNRLRLSVGRGGVADKVVY